MSKYTTEIRFICERAAGLKESAGAKSVDEIISKAWNKILYTTAPLYDESYREILFSKILKHFYLYEIGYETVGAWELAINRELEEILPYYNELYKSALLKFNPLYDVDETTTHTGKGTSSDNSKSAGNTNNTGKASQRYSDTPQGGLDGIENNGYLTSATISDTSENSNTNTESSMNGATTEDYVHKVVGKHGGASYAGLLKEYRETLINIDKMVFAELEPFFMGLW